MKSALMWLGVLVAIAVIILVVKSCGSDEAKAGGGTTPGSGRVIAPGGMYTADYEGIHRMLSNALAASHDDRGRGMAKAQFEKYYLYGNATVVSVEPEGAGMVVELDVNPEAGNGADVVADAAPSDIKVPDLAAGMKVYFQGKIVRIDVETDEYFIELRKTKIDPPQ